MLMHILMKVKSRCFCVKPLLSSFFTNISVVQRSVESTCIVGISEWVVLSNDEVNHTAQILFSRFNSGSLPPVFTV